MALLHHWKCDDNAASTTVLATTGTNIASGSGNTSTLRATGPGGSYPYSFLLNGSTQFLDAAAAALAIPTSTAFSVSAWINVSSFTNAAIAGVPAAANPGILFLTTTTLNVRSLTAVSQNYAYSARSTGVWYNVLVTRTAGNSVRTFINGTESSTGAVAQSGSFSFTVFGRRNTNYLPGSICGIKVYDSDESANAATLFNEGKPQNTVVPSITGTLGAGEVLTAGDGTWSDGSTSARAWRVADDASGTNATNISGATGSTYTLLESNVANGKYIGLRISRNNSIGTTTADSIWSEVTYGTLSALGSKPMGMGIRMSL
jgi:hypothetical protein